MSNKLSLARRVLPTGFTQMIGRQSLRLSKNSPHILFGVGVAGFIGTTILASRSTLRVDEILSQTEQKLKNVNELAAKKDLATKYNYDEEEVFKDKLYIYATASVDLTKLYAPAIGAGVLTLFCFTKSHMILTERNTSLMIAYTGLERAFAAYRKRVADQLDPEYERDIYYDAQKTTVEVEDPDDEEKSKEVGRKTIGGRAYSQHARFFDELCPNWQKTPEYNLIFLRAQQSYANDLLRSRGHVFLNEIYDMLGLDRSREGSVVGWIISKDGTDNYIDFGFMDEDNPRSRDFVNGREGAILLDFNVNGLIWDKIGS
jgi:hypothetical protein